ncbi:hypothetical protein ACIPUF_04425 [Pectobacterium sp. CHL-2024]|uniref:hypothetical protein n=1 Tax=Pectobacterium sp. CHL-2024 TaxID=3377079 RepID=UPI00382A7765
MNSRRDDSAFYFAAASHDVDVGGSPKMIARLTAFRRQSCAMRSAIPAHIE